MKLAPKPHKVETHASVEFSAGQLDNPRFDDVLFHARAIVEGRPPYLHPSLRDAVLILLDELINFTQPHWPKPWSVETCAEIQYWIWNQGEPSRATHALFVAELLSNLTQGTHRRSDFRIAPCVRPKSYETFRFLQDSAFKRGFTSSFGHGPAFPVTVPKGGRLECRLNVWSDDKFVWNEGETFFFEITRCYTSNNIYGFRQPTLQDQDTPKLDITPLIPGKIVSDLGILPQWQLLSDLPLSWLPLNTQPVGN